MRTLVLFMLLGSIVLVSCDYKDKGTDEILDDLVKRLLEEKQKEERLEKEREERRESNKLLYELEKILKRQDPNCKVTGQDCSHWEQCCNHKCVLKLGDPQGKCVE